MLSWNKNKMHIVAIVLMAALSASAVIEPPSLRYNDDVHIGLNAGGAWANETTKLTYNVTEVLNEGTLESYLYQYTLNIGATGAISHFILETSNEHSMVPGTFKITSGGSAITYNLGEPESHKTGNNNPGMPQNLYGMKLEDPTTIPLVLEWQFESRHVPMWGDFYAKDGDAGGLGTNYLFNAGFGQLGDPDPASTNYDYLRYALDNTSLADKHILVPDTQVVPAPGAVLLGFLGLGTAVIKLRKNKAKI